MFPRALQIGVGKKTSTMHCTIHGVSRYYLRAKTPTCEMVFLSLVDPIVWLFQVQGSEEIPILPKRRKFWPVGTCSGTPNVYYVILEWSTTTYVTYKHARTCCIICDGSLSSKLGGKHALQLIKGKEAKAGPTCIFFLSWGKRKSVLLPSVSGASPPLLYKTIVRDSPKLKILQHYRKIFWMTYVEHLYPLAVPIPPQLESWTHLPGSMLKYALDIRPSLVMQGGTRLIARSRLSSDITCYTKTPRTQTVLEERWFV